MPIATEHIGPAPLSASAEQHMVPMRDGVELATDVYLPASPGRCPTVLIRLPYDKNGRYCFMEQTAAEFTARGYATVVQDVRGKFRSQGETVPFVHEAEDGYDTIEGINRQQWSDAVVGMCGDSYFGFTQWAAVTTAHPALKAIVPRVTSMELAVAVPHREPERIVTLYAAEYLADYWASRDIVHTPIDHDRRPLLEAFEEAFTASRSRSAAFDSYVPHPQPAEPFPHGHPSQAAPVPTLHGVGWFDNLLGESMDDYTAMATHPAWGPVTYLYADSINHENHRLARSPVQPENDHSTDDKALRRTIAHDVAPVLEFFDVFLKGERPEESLPRVRWHLGHVGFRTSTNWPPPEAGEFVLHLAEPDMAVRDTDGGSLHESPKTPADPPHTVRWTHDPHDMVPSITGDPFSALREWVDESGLHPRPDLLTFTAAPASAPLDLAGPVRAELTVESTAPGMHLFAKLFDVFPDGSAHMLVRGQTVLPPRRGETVEIDLGHTGYRLRPGHRLRLQPACSDFPYHLWHSGTEENPWLATRVVTSTQTLSVGGGLAGQVRLTVLGAEE
ncbi:CocE/NonD family hydrolase [Streptomyces europaeiscabiei]|uniref:CocE/NonD family hydrolase n=1 Tax=Streptomyces europaeiscabiei TaxID=146819 RepID=UPI002E183F5B